MTDNTTNNSTESLEKQTLLHGSKPLNVLIQTYGNDEAEYRKYLHILIDGVDAVGQSYPYTNEAGQSNSYPVTNIEFQKIHQHAQSKQYSAFKTMTPAGKAGAFEPYGTEGVVCALNHQRLSSSPITGPKKNTPSLSEFSLNRIHPFFSDEIDRYCTAIKAGAYLALPAMAFGSLQRVVSALSGLASSIQKIMFSIYKGAIKAIQEFYAYVNGVIVKMQKMMFSVIEQIIPLDLMCLILEAIQVIADDISFFSAIFGQTGPINQYINTFQNYTNRASTLAGNPFTTLSAYLPPDIKNAIDMVDQIGSDPNGFLTDQLTNYGYAWAVNAVQGDIAGALVNKYGAQYAAIGPVGRILNASENYSRNLGFYPKTPAVIGPNITTSRGVPLDGNYNTKNSPKVTNENIGIKPK